MQRLLLYALHIHLSISNLNNPSLTKTASHSSQPQTNKVLRKKTIDTFSQKLLTIQKINICKQFIHPSTNLQQ